MLPEAPCIRAFHACRESPLAPSLILAAWAASYRFASRLALRSIAARQEYHGASPVQHLFQVRPHFFFGRPAEPIPWRQALHVSAYALVRALTYTLRPGLTGTAQRALLFQGLCFAECFTLQSRVLCAVNTPTYGMSQWVYPCILGVDKLSRRGLPEITCHEKYILKMGPIFCRKGGNRY